MYSTRSSVLCLKKSAVLLKRFSISTTKLKISSPSHMTHYCKVLVVGGGSAGCSSAAKLSKKLNKKDLIILEPAEQHYYQPLLTLIGGGVYKIDDARRPMKDVLPKNATWIKAGAAKFEPDKNIVTTSEGDMVKYDYLLIATGLETQYDKIPGLVQALETPNSGVCSNYSAEYVDRTFEALKNFECGNAIFTYPTGPVKCPGAPQKICYLSDDYLRKNGKRSEATLIYNTALPVIFGVKQYADALWKVCKERDVKVNLNRNLVLIRPEHNEAVFEDVQHPEDKIVLKYSLLHVTPPMSTPEALKNCRQLTNEAGFVDVDKGTMQSINYPNVFAIGDCSSTPNSKTAAAAAAQSYVVFKNMTAAFGGKPLTAIYDGYASCPLVTAYDKCILAEFDYSLTPLETFPIRQDRELYSMYLLKKLCMPQLYWHLMVKGNWNGPAWFRNVMHLRFFK